mmetsp:Transcript_11866/g.28050  ORF Transcript_11866/g.28050 Transcript_11866/m.28050 type:complete len:224 (+) Transcript_11866:81-752(+)
MHCSTGAHSSSQSQSSSAFRERRQVAAMPRLHRFSALGHCASANRTSSCRRPGAPLCPWLQASSRCARLARRRSSAARRPGMIPSAAAEYSFPARPACAASYPSPTTVPATPCRTLRRWATLHRALCRSTAPRCALRIMPLVVPSPTLRRACSRWRLPSITSCTAGTTTRMLSSTRSPAGSPSLSASTTADRRRSSSAACASASRPWSCSSTCLSTSRGVSNC